MNTTSAPRSLTAFHLKLIALTTMIIDHIGALLFSVPILRAVGRMAFPIYAFLIPEGCRHTQSRARYLLRLGLLALVSEIPYDWAFNSREINFLYDTNIFYTLFLAVLCVHIYEALRLALKASERLGNISVLLSMLPMLPIVYLAEAISCSYGAFGVMLIVFIYLAEDRPKQIAVLALGMVFRYGMTNGLNFTLFGVLYLCFALASVVLVCFYSGERGRNIKWSFYLAYPFHLVILTVIAAALLSGPDSSSISDFQAETNIIPLFNTETSGIPAFRIRTGSPDISTFREKAELLRPQSDFEDWLERESGGSPAGSAGYAVFISICDKTERASVYTGTGESLAAAWENAVERADQGRRENGIAPVWVKADVVYASELVSMEDLTKTVRDTRDEFFRYGAAFDSEFRTALLEAEMNGARIYEYDDGGIDFEYLNKYLKKAGRATLDELPEEVTLFRCVSWFCDENNQVYQLHADGLENGRRPVELVDGNFVKELIMNASGYLEEQVLENGSFIYGLYPRFDNEIDSYNIIRHAGTVWSMVCSYRLNPSEELSEKIDRTISYMLESMLYDDQGRAYLYSEKTDEIHVGGSSIAVLALTEYMDVFGNDRYKDVCTALGNGILTMLDQTYGTYYHVLNGDFSRKEEFSVIYYDGEATFALCRLYGLTGDPVWLEAAKSAVDHFIKADYIQYKDHWVAYSMNEITKYVTDSQEYYDFALKNAYENLKTIYDREITAPTDLELLMATFETYDRMIRNGGSTDDFDLESFLNTIYARANHQLNGYFFPEYAMYMRNPQRILDTFMVRQDGYRVRIDDVQHTIGGYYLYCVNYDKLVEYGMLKAVGVT